MKILIGMPSPDSWGGPISSEPPFVGALRNLGVDVSEEVYVFGDKDTPTPLFERIRRVSTTALRFRKLLKKEPFDLVHLNTAFDLRTILRDSFSLFVMKPKAKTFFKLHGSEAAKFEKANFFVRFLVSYIARKVDGFGVHTQEERASFLKLGFTEEKFYFVKNAVTICENIQIERKQKDADEVFDLLFVSRFIPTKGLVETIRACAIVRDKGFKFILHCVGDGETRPNAEKEVEKLDLQEFVKFTGYISESEVTKYFFNSDLLIFPTRHAEGFPNVLFKAVAVGMPVVTTRIRAAADYLRENENALFCTQEPENIAEKVVQILGNKHLRETISNNNVNFGRSLLPEAIAREFIEIYNEILQTK